MLNAICAISLTDHYFDSYNIQVYFILGINYVLSLCQYLEKFSIEGYSFDCIKPMGKILCIPEIVP